MMMQQQLGGSEAAAAQQSNMAEESYDEVFPALPESATLAPAYNTLGQWNNKMSIASSTVTIIFRVPAAERRMDHDSFGERDSHTCSKIMKETNANIEISTSKDQSLTFLITGKHNCVLEAKRKILANFQTQASMSLAIPKEHHRCVLGKAGLRLRELETKTATKITVPVISDQSDRITVTGNRDGIEQALHEIQLISDEQSKKAFERVRIPKMYHPFVCGANQENLNRLATQTGARINVPPPSVDKDEITITGEKEGVAAAKAEIIQIHKEMEKKCAVVSVEVVKAQHKYVIGPRGNGIAHILQKAGVSVEMPPGDSDSGTITLRGPQEKLGLGLSMVYEKASSFQLVNLKAPSWIHKYIIGRKGANIQKITQDLTKVHVEFSDKDNNIVIEGPPEEVEKAHSQLQEAVVKLLADMTYAELTVDPKFFKHIIGKAGANVNRLKEQMNVAINITEADGTNIIRIEGSSESVEQVKQELEEMVAKLENEKEKDAIIEQRFHRSLIGSKGDSIREIRDQFNKVQINFPPSAQKSDVVKIRGPKEDVDKCFKFLMKRVKEMTESMYVLEVPIYKQFHRNIIGKAGTNIRKIRDETETTIDLPAEGEKSDVIIITGKKAQVEEAKERIQKIQNELANIINDEVTIPPQFYNSLIGSGGKLVRAISDDCGGVLIKFPTADSKSDKVSIRGPKEDVERAKQQLLELTTEKQLSSFTAEVRAKVHHHRFLIGKSGANIRKIRDSTGARILFPTDRDEDKEVITIIGRQEAVLRAKAELETAIRDIDNVVEGDMVVSAEHHRHFVTRRGAVLRQIEEECGGVSISFPRQGTASERVVIKGGRQGVDQAKLKIAEIVHDLESMVTVECNVEQRHHRSLMGTKGANVQEIQAKFDVHIKFPDRAQDQRGERGDFGGGRDRGEYPGEPVNRGEYPGGRDRDRGEYPGARDRGEYPGARDRGEYPGRHDRGEYPGSRDRGEFPGERDGSRGEYPDPAGGVVSWSEEATPNTAADNNNYVNGDLEECDKGPRECDIIRIIGKEENCELARQALIDRIPVDITVPVPFSYHRAIIGQKGSSIRELEETFSVHIKVPNSDLQLDSIKISGTAEAVEQAREAVMGKITEIDADRVDRERKSFEVKLEVQPEYHPKIIGKGGTVISKIRSEHGVQINFPRRGEGDENVITITGYEEAALRAKEAILSIVSEIDDQTKEEVEIDYRVHSRLIGIRGRNVKKIMDEFHVDIKFPRSADSNPNMVTISGKEDDVLDAKDHLLNLEEEYMQDVNEAELRESYRPGNRRGEEGGDQPNAFGGGRGGGSGFVVKGGPWEQRAPDTASTEEFPTIGGRASAPQASSVPWGPRR